MQKCNSSAVSEVFLLLLSLSSMPQRTRNLGISRENYFDSPRNHRQVRRRSQECHLRLGLLTSKDYELECFHVPLCILFRYTEEKNNHPFRQTVLVKTVFHFRMVFLLSQIREAFRYVKSNQHLMQNTLSIINLFIFYQTAQYITRKNKGAFSFLNHYRYFFLQIL